MNGPKNLSSRLRLSLAAACALCAFILFYWMLSFSGPYRWFINYELSSSGAYHPGVAMFVALVCAAAIVFIPFSFAARRFQFFGPDVDGPQLLRDVKEKASRSTYRIIAFGVGFFLCGEGVYQFTSAA